MVLEAVGFAAFFLWMDWPGVVAVVVAILVAMFLDEHLNKRILSRKKGKSGRSRRTKK
jgi:hypothetical protein